jgi:hypothetical protein
MKMGEVIADLAQPTPSPNSLWRCISKVTNGALAPQSPHYFVNETASFSVLSVVWVHTKSEHPGWAVNVLSM